MLNVCQSNKIQETRSELKQEPVSALMCLCAHTTYSLKIYHLIFFLTFFFILLQSGILSYKRFYNVSLS